MPKIKTSAKPDRVVAIDYFRGLCMLAVFLTHSTYFSAPFNYLVGAGQLWTSAAEMFFLLSGITFWVVRGQKIADDFWGVAKHTWRRAGMLYSANFIIAFLSFAIIVFFTARSLPVSMPQALPSGPAAGILTNFVLLKNSFGWADFLMYYPIYLLIAPFALYILRRKSWFLVPAVSLGLFSLSLFPSVQSNHYFYFLVWQVYFFIGLTIARFRQPILRVYRQLPKVFAKGLAVSIVVLAAITLLVSGLTEISNSHTVAKLNSLTPLRQLHGFMLNHAGIVDRLFSQNRSGLLRPAVALLVMAGAYTLYQRYRQTLLRKTGWFVNTIGRNTLSVFMAQALVIPFFAALPIRHDSIAINLFMTIAFIWTMWLVAKRDLALLIIKAYYNQLSGDLLKIRYLLTYG